MERLQEHQHYSSRVEIVSYIDINEMQYGLMSGREAADSITICRQLQEKDLAKKKVFYFVFVNFEKAFGQIPRDVV